MDDDQSTIVIVIMSIIYSVLISIGLVFLIYIGIMIQADIREMLG